MKINRPSKSDLYYLLLLLVGACLIVLLLILVVTYAGFFGDGAGL